MDFAKNPQDLQWTDPVSYVDGTPFGANDLLGYEFGVKQDLLADYTPVLVLPVAYGVGFSPMPDAVKETKNVIQYIALRTVAKNGESSEWTGPIPVQFVSVPLAPTAFSAT